MNSNPHIGIIESWWNIVAACRLLSLTKHQHAFAWYQIYERPQLTPCMNGPISKTFDKSVLPGRWPEAEFSSLQFTVTSTALPCDFYFFKHTQPLTVSTVQLLYTIKEKGGKPNRKPYRNLKSENSQDYAQEPQQNCTFMNSARVQTLHAMPDLSDDGCLSTEQMLQYIPATRIDSSSQLKSSR
jgi:hypothetical protein